jgi:hypothetical protein
VKVSRHTALVILNKELTLITLSSSDKRAQDFPFLSP